MNYLLRSLPVSMKAKTNFIRCIGYLSFTKDHTKLDLLLILVLVLLTSCLTYDTVRRCMKLQIKIGFGQ